MTKENIVEVIHLNGEEYLHYKFPNRLDVVLIRGTTADYEGQVMKKKVRLLMIFFAPPHEIISKCSTDQSVAIERHEIMKIISKCSTHVDFGVPHENRSS